MIATLLGNQSVTVRIRTGTGARDGFGLKQESTVEQSVNGVSFMSLESSELDVNRIAEERWILLAPAGSAVAAVKSTDEIIHGDDTYRMDGEVQRRYDIDGNVNHLSVVCRRWAG